MARGFFISGLYPPNPVITNYPLLGFSFYNPDSNNYKTILTKPVNVSISSKEKSTTTIETGDTKTKRYNNHWKWWLAGAVLFTVIAILLIWFRKTRSTKKQVPVAEASNTVVSVAEILKRAHTFSEADDKTFYSVLRTCIWFFFTQHFGLTGSKMNRSDLAEVMQKKNIDEVNQKTVLEILDQCSTGVFTNAGDTADKKGLLNETKNVLVKIKSQLKI